MKHILKTEIDFEKMQKELGTFRPLREHDDGYVSLASCEKEWAPRFAFCDRDCFLDELLECISEAGIEYILATFLCSSSYFSDWMQKKERS